MTAPARDPLVEFKHLLPHYVSQGLHDTQRLVALVHRAARNGWTAAHLARECGRDLAGVTNAAAVVMHRLEQAADRDPPAGKPQRRPLCGQCEDGWLLNPETRLPVRRCPCRLTQRQEATA